MTLFAHKVNIITQGPLEENMFDSKKCRLRFFELVRSIGKTELGDFRSLSQHLIGDFDRLLENLGNYELDLELCVELIDLVLFDMENEEQSTISRLSIMYDGYSDFMLTSYMKLGLVPDDVLMKNLAKFDLDHGFTIDQLVSSGWFYYCECPLIQGLDQVILRSKKVGDIIYKVMMNTTCNMSGR